MNEELKVTQELLINQLKRIEEEMNELKLTSEQYKELETEFNNINSSLIRTNQRLIESEKALRMVEIEEKKTEQTKKSGFKWFVEKTIDIVKVAVPAAITGYFGYKTVQIVSKSEEEAIYGRQTGNLVGETYKNMNRRY